MEIYMMYLIVFYLIGFIFAFLLSFILCEFKKFPSMDEIIDLITISLWSWIQVAFLIWLCGNEYKRIFKKFFKIK